MNAVTFRLARGKCDFGWCAVIRTMVFVVEQQVPADIEIDGHEDDCRHILGLDGERPFATARWRLASPSIAKIERVAILKEWRGRGLGKDLMGAVVRDIAATAPGCATLRLGAQDHAIPFYEKAGFAVFGDGFIEGGIPHHMMERAL